MGEIKPSYTELVYQVVREAKEPLLFDEITQRVNAFLPISTKNPRNTIRNAINQSRLVVSTGDGRYGWKYRLIDNSVLRLPLNESNLLKRQLVYTQELRDALWPAFFEAQKRNDRSPVYLRLPDGKVFDLTLEWFGEGTWGSTASPEFWNWCQGLTPQPGDDLIFRVIDGEGRHYAVDFQPHSGRDEQAIAERNRQIIQATSSYNQRKHHVLLIWDISSYLLSSGLYKHSVPTDPLEQILKDELWGPDLLPESPSPGWMLKKQPEIDPLVASLLDEIGRPRRGQRLKKEPLMTTPAQIYQLKVTLQSSRPSIWRRILAPDDIFLPRLHAVLQIVMGWTNSHLHGFKANGKFYSEPSQDYEDLMDVVDERQIHLRQIAPGVSSRFVYEYDFGDSWEHELVVEKILPAQEAAQYPLCLGGKSACPPDDVGGVRGYSEFLEAIRHPRHPEHDEWLQWAGGKFDPAAFDLPKVNKLLRDFQLLIEGL